MAALILLGALMMSSQVMAATCPVKSVEENFNLSRFMGKWYFVELAPTIWHSADQYKCTQLDFALQSNGEVKSDFTLFDKTSGKYQTMTRTIRRETPGGTDGRLRIFRDGSTGGNMYHVLYTDYDDFAVIYLCRENSNDKTITEMPYVVSRNQTAKLSLQVGAIWLMPTGIKYVKADQTGCPAWS